MAVFVFHAGVTWAPGGVFGVDAFFVLSGYLITGTLLGEHARTGRIALRAFYTRRIRRLLPGALLLLVGTVALWRWTADPAQLSALRGDVLATLGYVANWHFAVTGQSYFDQFVPPSPLLHMWSLGVEEQFYVLWPLLMLLVLRGAAPGRGWRRVASSCLILTVLSTVACVLLARHGVSTSRLYYGTDTRAPALLVGGLLACLIPLPGRLDGIRQQPGRGRHRGLQAIRSLSLNGCLDRIAPRPRHGERRTLPPIHPRHVGFAVLGLVGAAASGWALGNVSGQSPTLYRGGGFVLVALAVASLVASVVVAPDGPVGRLLSARPLVALGRVSYGVYLWHWPVLLFLSARRTGTGGAELFALRAATTLLLATVSWYLLEQPVLRGRLSIPKPRLAVPALVVGMALAGLVVPLPVVPSGAAPNLTAAANSGDDPPSATGALLPVSARPARVLMLGDSVVLSMGVELARVARTQDVAFSDQGTVGCGVASNGPLRVQGAVVPALPACRDYVNNWASQQSSDRADVVAIMVGRWELFDRMYQGQWRAVGDPVFDAYLMQALEDGIRALQQRGARIALLTPACNFVHELPDGNPASEDDPTRVRRFTTLLEDVASRYTSDQVRLYDVGGQLCPGGQFRAATPSGTPLRAYDGIHVSDAGGVLVGRWLLPQLVQYARETPIPSPAGVLAPN